MKSLSSAFIGIVTIGSALGQNLLVNGDFESSPVDDAIGTAFIAEISPSPPGFQFANVETNANVQSWVTSGVNFLDDAVFNGPVGSNYVQLNSGSSLSQTNLVLAGGPFNLTFESFAIGFSSETFNLDVDIRDAITGQSFTSETVTIAYDGQIDQVSIPVTLTAPTLVNVSFSGGQGSVGLDNVALAPAPEPASTFLLAIATPILLRRRR